MLNFFLVGVVGGVPHLDQLNGVGIVNLSGESGDGFCCIDILYSKLIKHLRYVCICKDFSAISDSKF